VDEAVSSALHRRSQTKQLLLSGNESIHRPSTGHTARNGCVQGSITELVTQYLKAQEGVGMRKYPTSVPLKVLKMYPALPSSFSAAFSSGSATSSHHQVCVSHMLCNDVITFFQWEELSPRPVPENLCELRGIVADISRTVDQSPYVSAQIKASLRECNRNLEAECANLQHLTQLAHRAARDASYVLRWRARFFDRLHERILELSRLRAGFDGSRQAFHERVSNLLTGEIRNAKGSIHDGVLSRLKPSLDRIDKYYHEVDVSLHTEEKCLKKIRSSLRVTSDDKRRWEHIRDACKEAFNLLTTRVSATFC